MSDETMPEATAASETKSASEEPAPAGGTEGEARSGPDGPKRRRRRGSRGGRNRRKRTAAGRVSSPGAVKGTAPPTSGVDHTDAAADRGLTTEDVAAEAKEEAGLDE